MYMCINVKLEHALADRTSEDYNAEIAIASNVKFWEGKNEVKMMLITAGIYL